MQTNLSYQNLRPITHVVFVLAHVHAEFFSPEKNLLLMFKIFQEKK